MPVNRIIRATKGWHCSPIIRLTRLPNLAWAHVKGFVPVDEGPGSRWESNSQPAHRELHVCLVTVCSIYLYHLVLRLILMIMDDLRFVLFPVPRPVESIDCLFTVKCLNRIDACRATGRKPTCDQRDDGQCEHHACKQSRLKPVNLRKERREDST